MQPNYLLPENVARQDGISPAIELGETSGKPLLLTLGITRILEQESLEVSIWGSEDGASATLLFAYPRKFYCGTYLMALDLRVHPEVKFLHVRWKMNRWGSFDSPPLFGFYVFAEESSRATAAAVA